MKLINIIGLLLIANITCAQSYYVKAVIKDNKIETFTPQNSEVFLLRGEIRIWVNGKNNRENIRIKTTSEIFKEVKRKYREIIFQSKELGDFIYLHNYQSDIIVLKGKLIGGAFATLILIETGDF